MITPEVASTLCKVLQDCTALALWGTYGFLATIILEDLARHVERTLTRILALLAIVSGAVTLVTLPVMTASLADGWRQGLDRMTLLAYVQHTQAGHASLGQGLMAVTGMGVLALVQPSILRTRVLAVVYATFLLSLVWRGHAAVATGLPGLVRLCAASLHVLAAGAWLGGLVPLLVVFASAKDQRFRAHAVKAMKSFSRAGHLAVAIVIASGMANTFLILGHLPLGGTEYQRLLVLKISVVTVMVLMAVFNRYVLVPRISRERPYIHRALVRSTVTEILLGAAAIALVAVYSSLDPV